MINFFIGVLIGSGLTLIGIILYLTKDEPPRGGENGYAY
jgi:hypothetical protein